MLFSKPHGSLIVYILLIFHLNFVSSANHHPRLSQIEKRSAENLNPFRSFGSLYSKRDECGTQFGPTYFDCGSRGCFQPSLGEVCCGANNLYCPQGQYCAGNYCCLSELPVDCCLHGNGCPASTTGSYSTSPPPSSTTFTPSPLSSTSIKPSSTTTASPQASTTSASTVPTPTSAKATTSTSLLVQTTSASTAASTKTANGVSTLSSTSTGTSSGAAATQTQTQSSGAAIHRMKIMMGVYGLAVLIVGLL